MTSFRVPSGPLAALFALALVPAAAVAQPVAPPAAAGPSYADLADLSDEADLVIHAQIRKQIEVKPERAPGLAPGDARLYIEARTLGLIAGSTPVGETLRYLIDVPRDERGRVPKLKKREMLLFAQPVRGRPGEIQLIGSHGQLPYSAQLADRLRDVLAQFARADAPPAITGIRDALSVEGNLAGESETQIFLSTERDGPVSITVVRRPGMAPVWGVSWSEIVDQAARPPMRNTPEWYRLACFLPAQLPGAANLSRESASRGRAAADYRFVIEQLGACPRNLR